MKTPLATGQKTEDPGAPFEKEAAFTSRYRELFEANPQPMWVYGLATLRFLAVNEAALHHYGYSRAEFLGMTLRDIRPPDDVPALEKAVASVVPGLNPAGVWRHRKKDGQIIEVEITSHTLVFDGQEAELVLATDVTERRRAEAELVASREGLATVFRASPDSIVIVRASDERIVQVNPGFTRITGFAAEEVTGRTTLEIDLWVDQDERRTIIAQLKKTGSVVDVESRLRTKAGSIITVLASAQLIEFGGEPCLLSVSRDISGRKQAETALRKSRQRFEQLVSTIEGIVWEADAQTFRFSFVSQQAERLLGYPLEKWSAPGFWAAHIHPDDRAAATEHYETCTRQGRDHDLEYRMIAADGRVVWLRDIVTVLVEQGVPRLLRGLMVDVTGRKEAAAELERSLSTLQLFINTVPAYISFVDAGERYRLVNKSYEEYFGRPAEQLIGQRICDVQPPAAYAEMQPHIRTALAGQAVHYESNPTGPDGRSYWFDVQYVPRRGADGAVTGFFVLVFDISVSKQNEVALRDSRHRLDSILNSMEGVVYSSTPDGRTMLFVSASAEALYGQPASAFLADPMKWLAAVHPEDREAVTGAFGRALEAAEFDVEYRIIRPDGAVRWVHDRARIVRDDHGQPLRLDGLAMDITERRAAGFALQERERAYASLLKNLAGMVYQGKNDAHWTTTFVSEGCLAVTGYRSEDLVGNRKVALGDLIHPEDAPAVWEKWQASLAARRPCSNEYRIRTASGTERWVWDQAQGVYAPNGELLFVEGYITDITERKLAVDALQEREERLRAALSASGTGTFRWDIRTNALDWDDALDALFGLPEGETVRSLENFIAMVHPDERPGVIERCERCALDGADFEMEFRVLWPDGSVHWLDDRGKIFFDSAGRPLYMTGACVDITAQKKAEEDRVHFERQIQHAQKLESLGVLAGGIAHDFNNLLSVVMGNVGLALYDLPPGSPARTSLREAELATQRAAELARQMLAYSGKGRFVVQSVRLAEVVGEMVSMLQVSISKKAIMRFHFMENEPTIEADVTQLRQIVLNLVTNASDAIGDRSGVISVSTGVMECYRAYLATTWLNDPLTEGSYAYLEVADSGCGMTKEQLPKIFDPFFTTKFTGRGLGLAAVLGIVRGHKGAIKVDSEIGKGTTFKVLFPLGGEATSLPEAKGDLDAGLQGGGLILLVDDEESIRAVGKRMLQRLGFEVILAADGFEALAEILEQGDRIWGVVLDLTMPRMDGEETFRELRHIRTDIPVILSSGYSEHDVVQRFAGKGIAGFVPKPYTLANLQSVLTQALGKRAPTPGSPPA